MSLKVYNSLSRKKEDFEPLQEGKVKMYVCGPTVYNYISIGNARPIIVFNMVRNYLEYLGYEVFFVQNITDIEDKIINKANLEGVDYKVITKRYIDAFMEDLEALEIKKIDEIPLASDMINEIISMIEKIIENGYGYVIDGNVYFDVLKFKDYGKLSGQKISEMKNLDEDDFVKRNKIDFALWKQAKPGEPSWQSPWGNGRPGWHIECSAMSYKFLGFGFDIHGGGIDLIFPHHENEIAQSEAAFKGKGNFVKYWMHNGMIEVKEKKMSKSDGLQENWILKNLLKKYSSNVIKFYILSTHYKSPLEFSKEKLEESKKALDKVVNTVQNLDFLLKKNKNISESLLTDDLILKVQSYKEKVSEIRLSMVTGFKSQMDDDFNSAGAIGVLFDSVRRVNSIIQSPDFLFDKELLNYLEAFYNDFLNLYHVLGINLEKELNKRQAGFDKAKPELSSAEIEALVSLRDEARKAKDFKKADEIRNKLLKAGIVLEDRKEGTFWKIQK